MSRVPGLVWSVPAVCAALLAATYLVGRRSDLPAEATDVEALILVPLSLGFAMVGALVLSRHPRHGLGWLYLGSATAMAIALFVYAYAWYGLVTAPGALPAAVAVGWVSAWVWTFGFAPALTFGLLLYPDGRLPSRRWWPAAGISALGLASLAIASAFAPGPLVNHPAADNPVGIDGAGQVLTAVGASGAPLVFVGFAAGVAALAVRWHRARPGGIERRQISMLAVTAGLCLVIVLVPFGTDDHPSWPATAAILAAFALVPAAIGTAILRHHLYDIDIVLNRTLVYGGLTGCVIAAYAAVVWVLGRPLGSATAISIVATAVIAALVLPLRSGLQRLVDKAMYGDRGDPYTAMSRLTSRLQAAAAPGEALRAVTGAIAESLHLPYVAVRTAAGILVESGDAGPVEPHPIRLVHQGEQVGTLLVEGRDRRPLTARDLDLLTELARSAGAAVYAAGLADALRASRQALVLAREEERRRLRRDLHDGLGPTLAAVGLGLDAAADAVGADPDAALELLAELRQETAGAVDEIRRLVFALRPPALDEVGLVSAIRQQVERLSLRNGHIDIRVEAAGVLPRLGAATEVAAYRIAMEAVSNAARHSGGKTCTVRLAADEMLTVEVVDGGCGISDSIRPGVGLSAMRERAREIGGECAISRTGSGGTMVLAELPLEPP